MRLGLAVIVASYLPALIYYNKQQKVYNEFIKDLSVRYEHRIKDKDINEMKAQKIKNIT